MMKFIDSLLLLAVAVISANGISKNHKGSETTVSTVSFASTEQPGSILFQSSDHGNTWQNLSAVLPAKLQVSYAFAHGEELYLGAANGVLYHSNNPKSGFWEREVISETSPQKAITGIFNGHSGLYVSVFGKGFFRKKPGTTTWEPMGQTLREKNVHVVLENADGTIFVACPGGIYQSDDDCKTWKQVLKEEWVMSLVASGNILVCNSNRGLFRSTDSGLNWEPVLHDENATYKTKFIDGRFIATRMGGTWLSPIDYSPQSTLVSNDNGKTWERFDGALLSNQRIYDLEEAGPYLFSSHKMGVSRSKDGGKTWELMGSTAILGDTQQFELVVMGQLVFAVVMNWGC